MVRPVSKARATARSASKMIFCGRLCKIAGRDRTVTGHPRRATISRTCPASAPQARISTGGALLAGGALCSPGTPQTPVALTPREIELVDEAVVEVGTVGELDIPHLLQQGQAARPLAQAEQRHLRPLARYVAGRHHARHRHLGH